MSHNTFGHLFRITTWGESHGPAIGCVVDGCPPGIPLTEADIQAYLDKRKPGQSRFTTQRQEPDQVRILSGVFTDEAGEQVTTGTPIALEIANMDARSKDYGDIKDKFRPGHADYTYFMKYGLRDWRGSGRASRARDGLPRGGRRHRAQGRAGHARARRARSRSATDAIERKNWRLGRGRATIRSSVRTPRQRSAGQNLLDEVRKAGSSVGAVIEIVADGVPAGLGAPIYGKLDQDIASRADEHQRGEGRGDRRRLRRRGALRRGECRRDAQCGLPAGRSSCRTMPAASLAASRPVSRWSRASRSSPPPRS